MNWPKKAYIILAILCIASFLLMLGSSVRDSVVVDELAHIPAGYDYVHFFDYRLNPEHPPLLKALAAVPLLFMHLNFPTTNPFWTTAVNGEWGVGGAFLFGLKNNPYRVIGWARVVPMLLTVALVLFTYLWAKKILGSRWALLPAAMLGLSPIILANGHYVTTDIAAAFGTMLGLATFVHFLKNPELKTLIFAGVGLGVAELLKFSTLALLPAMAVVMFFYAMEVPGQFWRQLGRYIWQYLLIVFIAYAFIVYPVYALFTAHYPAAKQLADTVAVLGNPGNCNLKNIKACMVDVNLWTAGHQITRPLAQYLLGTLMNMERIVGTNVSYFLGHVYSGGTPLYFPVVYGLKEALPILILLLAALILAISRLIKRIGQVNFNGRKFMSDHLAEFSMVVFLVIYWGVSISSPLNIGVRHLLPTLPLMYILAAGVLSSLPNSSLRNGFIGVMMVWLGVETAIVYPNFLSYFNELGGGTSNGYKFVDDSNYDWGQDMYQLLSWSQQHPEANKIALDFFGGSNPAYYLGDKYVPWQPSMGNPTSQNIHWFAISITNLQNDIEPGSKNFTQTTGQYSWLFASHPRQNGLGGVPKPDFRVGTTIFVYKLSG